MNEKNEVLTLTPKSEASEKTMPENSLTSGDSAEEGVNDSKKISGESKDYDADSFESFESLIKGRYKKEFSDKVQEIISKRFKENKLKEQEKTNSDSKEDASTENPELFKEAAELVAMGFKDFDLEKEMKNATFKALIKGGLDLQTAYKAIHFDEIMDGSVEYGATMAAKQLADSIRFKVARPPENGLTARSGFAPHRGASGLTPEARRELAKKALMGENIGF